MARNGVKVAVFEAIVVKWYTFRLLWWYTFRFHFLQALPKTAAKMLKSCWNMQVFVLSQLSKSGKNSNKCCAKTEKSCRFFKFFCNCHQKVSPSCLIATVFQLFLATPAPTGTNNSWSYSRLPQPFSRTRRISR